jgi:hypothetical protein
VDQGQFSDPDFISGTHERENVQFADKLEYHIALFLGLSLHCHLKKEDFLEKGFGTWIRRYILVCPS